MLTRTIADFSVGLNAKDIPDVVIEHAKVGFLDWLGVLIAGKDEPVVMKLLKYVSDLGGNEQASIIGQNVKVNVIQAALVNGAASHALDYDDTLSELHGHPSVGILPALVALAEWRGISGSELLAAYITAIEVGAVIGKCAGNQHYNAGWHGTSTIGHLASAAGCARLMELDAQKTVYALGIAGTQSSGLRGVFGTMCKPFHAGMAARAGIESVLLAQQNFTSAENILECTSGFLQTLHGKGIDEEAVMTMGKQWYIQKLHQKFHASCDATHSPIEAVQSLVDENNISSEDIHQILVNVPAINIQIAGKSDLKSGLDGKFSIAYSLANALLRGDTGPNAFTDEKVRDPQIREFMQRIFLQADTELHGIIAIVKINTCYGKSYVKKLSTLDYLPEVDEKRKKVMNKFISLIDPILGDKKASDLAQAVLSLEKCSDISELIKLI